MFLNAEVRKLFRPELLVAVSEGYGRSALRVDVLAGLTVAVVALPLSMAIAIASGVRPEAGLVTAIIGGLVVSLLGGSRYQIAGPAGAFIVLIADCVLRTGVAGLATATLISGVLITGIGLLRAGRYIRYVPYPVTLGFTAGIGLIILASQLKPFFGLTLEGPEPGPIVEKIPALWAALPSWNWEAALIAFGVIAMIWSLTHYAPKLPSLLIAIVVAAALTLIFRLDVATIGSTFGALPKGLPWPELPDLALIYAVLPDALGFALLGSIESLLSASVADGMSGRKHRPDTELVAQGLANIASALFGGIPVTGTIARTATNVRAGATSPVSGIVHAVALLLFILLAGGLVTLIPLAALAGLLTWVSLHMLNLRQIADFIRHSRAEALIILATLGLTLFHDLTEGIVVGIALSALVTAQRLSKTMLVSSDHEHPTDTSDPDRVTISVSGAVFFGSFPMVETLLEQIGKEPKALVFDLTGVSFMDASAANGLVQAMRQAKRHHQTVSLSGATPAILKVLKANGYSPS
jgi:sulfate permease, SulP family